MRNRSWDDAGEFNEKVVEAKRKFYFSGYSNMECATEGISEEKGKSGFNVEIQECGRRVRSMILSATSATHPTTPLLNLSRVATPGSLSQNGHSVKFPSFLYPSTYCLILPWRDV